MEARRLLAMPELATGSPVQLVKRYGVSRQTIYRWRRAVLKGESLYLSKAHGRPSALSEAQLARVKEAYLAGPAAAGYPRDHWTQGTFAVMIQRLTGVKYCRDHVGRLLHRIGCLPTREKP